MIPRKICLIKNKKFNEKLDPIILKIVKSFLSHKITIPIIMEDECDQKKREVSNFDFIFCSEKSLVTINSLHKKTTIICLTKNKAQKFQKYKNDHLFFLDMEINTERLDELIAIILNTKDHNSPLKLKIHQINLENQLKNLKALHKNLFPHKVFNSKNLTGMSKYAQGFLSGGDFFEYINREKQITLFIFSAKNYRVSSIVMSLYEKFRSKKRVTYEGQQEFLKNILEALVRDKKTKINDFPHLSFINIDPISLCIEGIIFGEIEIISKSHYFYGTPIELLTKELKHKKFNIKLKRNEKIMISSPGVRFCWPKKKKDHDFIKIIRDKISLETQDTLNDIFFSLKKKIGKEKDYLDCDATVIVLEASKNTLIKA